MIIRTLTTQVPAPRSDGRLWVAFQLEQYVDDIWSPAQAGAIDASQQQHELQITARFDDRATAWRTVFIPDDGSSAGLCVEFPKPFTAPTSSYMTVESTRVGARRP